MKEAAAVCAILFARVGDRATRIYLGAHYPSDVLGGYLVAITWIAIVLSQSSAWIPSATLA